MYNHNTAIDFLIPAIDLLLQILMLQVVKNTHLENGTIG